MIDINLVLYAIIAIFGFLTALEEKWRRISVKEKAEIGWKLANNRNIVDATKNTVDAVKTAFVDKKLTKKELETILNKVVILAGELDNVDFERL